MQSDDYLVIKHLKCCVTYVFLNPLTSNQKMPQGIFSMNPLFNEYLIPYIEKLQLSGTSMEVDICRKT